MKYAEQNVFCICVDVFKTYERDDYDKIFEVLSTPKIKKLKKNTLIEIYKYLLKNLDFEQNKCSLTSTGIFKIAHDSIRLLKWICYYDKSYYENIYYYDIMASISACLNEIP